MLKWPKIKTLLLYTKQEQRQQQQRHLPEIQSGCLSPFPTLSLTFMNCVPLLPPSFRLRVSSPYVHSYLELKARNNCLPHCPHFLSLLPFSSLVVSPL